MVSDGSFWLLYKEQTVVPDTCGLLIPELTKQPYEQLRILFMQEYRNIYESCIISRLLLERYSNDTIGIYISTRIQSATLQLFNSLSHFFVGELTVLNVRGPIALNTKLTNFEQDSMNLHGVFNAIDQIELIKPLHVREKLYDLLLRRGTAN